MKNIFDAYFQSHFKNVNDLSEKGFEKSAKYYAYFYRKFLPRDKNAKILDIGCGTGQFLYFLQKQGFNNYCGIDVSKQQIDFCRKKITPKVKAIDAFQFLKGKKDIFDLITLNDVLEHIAKNNIIQLLSLIYDSLKSGGFLFVKVPNMSNPFGLLDRYKDITHGMGFTEHSLKQVLSAANFSDVFINGVSYPAISLKSIISKIPEKTIHLCLKTIMVVQGYSAPKFLSKNIIAVSKKK